jgi:hypothetical protein
MVTHFLRWLILVGVLLCMFDFSFLMTDSGKLLLFDIVRIVCHSVFFIFLVRGVKISFD